MVVLEAEEQSGKERDGQKLYREGKQEQDTGRMNRIKCKKKKGRGRQLIEAAEIIAASAEHPHISDIAIY